MRTVKQKPDGIFVKDGDKEALHIFGQDSAGFARFNVRRETGSGWTSTEVKVRRVDDKNPDAALQLSIEQVTCKKNFALNAKRKETFRTQVIYFDLPIEIADMFAKSAAK